ncbi:hypothetical protein BO78DRAFT_167453 [Aspergillus sclerotiicarbonarius CBS 121057]|uniref:Lipocalin-like domain-containing protein n=1 Tax=Aspergillus sclerotiicarbonarius (strain CBS 121057 / IBT 28362) TaxID=1448318 RepID=A0A319ETR4_ASPSB|nr:hypothetical protein BO78DRAFT_167453 [Aspergillus sclerotiicarbonarius CBS 121057]
MASHLLIGLPKVYASKGNKCVPPTNDFLLGTWHVTHSSLPLWKDKCNVNITYQMLPPDASGTTRIDDLVRYQAIGSEKVKTVHGVDTATPGNPGAWDWRGKGWLMIASSHWECLGFGKAEDGNQWLVTYFAKTLFTPAGVDIYSRTKEGLPQPMIDEILTALKGLGVEDITELASSIFPIPRTSNAA